MTTPKAYLITFRTYGTWLHGDPRGSVDRKHAGHGLPMRGTNAALEAAERGALQHPPFVLDARQRDLVARAIEETCSFRGWALHAITVRIEHVHVVIGAEREPPERVLGAMKSWSTRRLVEAGVQQRGTHTWSRHGSTRYLWTDAQLERAIRYVREGQGGALPVAP